MFEKNARLVEEVFPELFAFEFVASGPVKASQLRQRSPSDCHRGAAHPENGGQPNAPGPMWHDAMPPAVIPPAHTDSVRADDEQQLISTDALLAASAGISPALSASDISPTLSASDISPALSASDISPACMLECADDDDGLMDWALGLPAGNPAEAASWLALPPAPYAQNANQHESKHHLVEVKEEEGWDEQQEVENDGDAAGRQHARARETLMRKPPSSRAPRVRKRMEDNVDVTLSHQRRITLTEDQLNMTQVGLLRAVAAALATATLSEHDKAILLHEQKRYRMRVSSRRRRDQRAAREQALRSALERSQTELDSVMQLVEKCSAPHMSPATLAGFLASTRAAIEHECGLPASSR